MRVLVFLVCLCACLARGLFVPHDGPRCLPGTFRAADRCVPCARNTFSVDTDADACDDCDLGQFTDGEGATACLDEAWPPYLDDTEYDPVVYSEYDDQFDGLP